LAKEYGGRSGWYTVAGYAARDHRWRFLGSSKTAIGWPMSCSGRALGLRPTEAVLSGLSLAETPGYSPETNRNHAALSGKLGRFLSGICFLIFKSFFVNPAFNRRD
jgi:hypothetical protein